MRGADGERGGATIIQGFFSINCWMNRYMGRSKDEYTSKIELKIENFHCILGRGGGGSLDEMLDE